MKELTERQFEVLSLLDPNAWRPLNRPDSIVAGVLCKQFRNSGRRYVERQPDLNRSNSASTYRLTPDGLLRLKFERSRRVVVPLTTLVSFTLPQPGATATTAQGLDQRGRLVETAMPVLRGRDD